ncbi:multicellular organismal development [Nesidiocoris tenuis]|nr:multicellular organismal development [Nesidiocoris tenuis]
MDQLADEQKNDPELRKLLQDSQSSLRFKQNKLPSGKDLWCDISTNVIRPFIPKKFRQAFFNQVHGLHHPGVKSTVKQMNSRFVWPSINKDVNQWAKSCLSCQKAKVSRHTTTPIMNFPTPDARFSALHIDLVGPLPPSDDFRYFLSIIDRFTNWMEAIPLTNIMAETVAQATYENWIVRYGVPSSITTDQGRQFEATLFQHLSEICGIKLQRTTAYHPQSNGKVERLHRTLKAALRANGSMKWSRILPTILLGLRAAVNPETGFSIAQMVYGTTIKLPGEFFGQPAPRPRDVENFVTDLQEKMRQLKPVPVQHKQKQTVFVHKDLDTCSHAFVRIDRLKKSLEPPYNGPFKILERHEKYFTLLIENMETNVSKDRLKPAYLFVEPDDVPIHLLSTPDACSSPSIPQDEPAPPNAQRTRSGRIVKFPSRFVSQIRTF